MRAIFVKLRDAGHRLPMPGSPGRFFVPEGETVDLDDPFWINCLADGSLVVADPAPGQFTLASTTPATPEV